MAEHVHDKYGGNLRIEKHDDGLVTIWARSKGWAHDEFYEAEVCEVDPGAVIAAIRVAAQLDDPELADDEIHSPVVEEAAEQINGGETTVSFEEAIGRRSQPEDAEEPQTFPLKRDEHGQFRPATAEVPRLYAGADEPIIDQLIGRVTDLEEGHVQGEVFAHQHLSEHWERRLDVARLALAMTPAKGQVKPTGTMSALFGSERSGEVSVTDALKIARFAADEDRDIPGVDR